MKNVITNEVIFTVINTKNTYSSYKDFSLIRTSKTIGVPSIKENKIEIPGMNGLLDMSEFFGELKYDNRPLSINFVCMEAFDDFDTIFSNVQNCLHGQRVKVQLDKDWYYTGRCNINPWKVDKVLGTVVIDVDAEPYKLKCEPTSVSSYVDEESTITCQNERMTVVPTITADADFVLKFGDISVPVSAGESIAPDIKFVQGENIVTCIGTGNITFTYQEGSL